MNFHTDGSSLRSDRQDQSDDNLYAADSIYDPDVVIVDAPESGFLWCRECKRVFRYGQFRRDGDHRLCPFDDCDGNISEALTWEIRQTHHPAFPKFPMEGNRYKRGC